MQAALRLTDPLSPPHRLELSNDSPCVLLSVLLTGIPGAMAT